nr:MAG TPA: hypothetical protein [Caudoviricetes sp.]
MNRNVVHFTTHKISCKHYTNTCKVNKQECSSFYLLQDLI